MSAPADFSQKRCIPCEGIGRAMTQAEVADGLKNVHGWTIGEDNKSIERAYVFKNFVQGVDMINLIKNIAEEERHHPDLHLTGYKNLKVVLYTHALDGLTENDFIVAAKINKLG